MTENKWDELHVSRMQHWRNLQIQDRNFDRQKQTVLWPLFEHRREAKAGAPARKMGYNHKLYKSLESVTKINGMQPVLSMSEKSHKKVEPEEE